MNCKKTVVTTLIILALALSPLATFGAHEELKINRKPPEPGAIVVDLVIARPIGAVVTVAGTVIFVAALPFSLLGGNTEDTWESLVLSPAEYTFKRPMGEFED